MKSYYSFLLATFLISIAPGLNAITIIQASIQNGIKNALLTLSGQITSIISIMIFVAYGISWMNPKIFQIFQLMGCAYLSYLGIQYLFFPKHNEIQHENFGFTKGFLINTSNPKSIVFQASFVPQFIVHQEKYFQEYFLLCSITIFVEILVMTFYAISAYKAKKFLEQEKAKIFFNQVCGFVFLTIVGFFIFESKNFIH